MGDRIDPVFVWAAVGAPDEPPQRVQVEACVTCGCWVPVAVFDRHGLWHSQAILVGDQ